MPKNDTKTDPVATQELVPLLIPLGENDEEPNQYININGKEYLIPKGKECMVPPEVAWHWNDRQQSLRRYNEIKRLKKEEEAALGASVFGF